MSLLQRYLSVAGAQALIIVIMVLQSACVRAELPAGKFIEPPPPIVNVPVHITKGGHILVEGAVGEQRGYWILDTGSPYIALNNAQVSDTGIKIGTRIAQGCNGDELSKLRLQKLQNVRWGPITIRDVAAVSINLEPFAYKKSLPPQLSGLPFLGLLGMAQLKPFLTIFDYKEQQIVLALLDGSGSPIASLSDTSHITEHKLTTRKDGVSVTIAVNDSVAGNFRLDTGSDDIIIYANFAKQAGIVPNSTARDSTICLGSDTIVMARGVIDKLTIGKSAYSKLPVLISEQSSLDADQGLLGSPFFSKKTVGINFRKGRLYIWDTAKEHDD